jgi:hypothetical protein
MQTINTGGICTLKGSKTYVCMELTAFKSNQLLPHHCRLFSDASSNQLPGLRYTGGQPSLDQGTVSAVAIGIYLHKAIATWNPLNCRWNLGVVMAHDAGHRLPSDERTWKEIIKHINSQDQQHTTRYQH